MVELQQLPNIAALYQTRARTRWQQKATLVQGDMNLAQDNVRPHTAPLKEKRVLETRWEVI